jgi:hypothetical protein
MLIKGEKTMKRILTTMAVLLICLPLSALANDETTSSLRVTYGALPKEQRRDYLKRLTADQMDQFIRETVQFTAKDKTPEQISKNWEELAVLTGDRFEQWGEKLMAENRRLTRERILELLKDEGRDFAWRVAFHGYLRIVFKNSEPRDAYEIGLTKDEVAKLKPEILEMHISPPNKEPEATR